MPWYRTLDSFEVTLQSRARGGADQILQAWCEMFTEH